MTGLALSPALPNSSKHCGPASLQAGPLLQGPSMELICEASALRADDAHPLDGNSAGWLARALWGLLEQPSWGPRLSSPSALLALSCIPRLMLFPEAPCCPNSPDSLPAKRPSCLSAG